MSNASLAFQLRPIDGYENEIRTIFRETLFLGRPSSATIDCFHLYESLCIDWYLQYGKDDAVVVIDAASGEVAGYALLCFDTTHNDYWVRGKVRELVLANAKLLIRGKLSRSGMSFYARRLLDAITIFRRRVKLHMEMTTHVHVNIRSAFHSGSVALALMGHIDDSCRRRGVTEWVGEMNARHGTRVRAIQRVVGEVVDVAPNRTMSHALGVPVHRMTIRRVVV